MSLAGIENRESRCNNQLNSILDSGEEQTKTLQSNCRWQEEPAILISRLLLRICHMYMYVASIRLDFH